MKKIQNFEIKRAAQEAAINSLPLFEGNVEPSLVCALNAQKQFWDECPEIVDYLKASQIDLTGLEGAFIPGTDESENTHWTKECQDHGHDCWREGCGRSVSESYSFWGTLVVLAPNGSFVVAAEFNQNVKGGYEI